MGRIPDGVEEVSYSYLFMSGALYSGSKAVSPEYSDLAGLAIAGVMILMSFAMRRCTSLIAPRLTESDIPQRLPATVLLAIGAGALAVALLFRSGQIPVEMLVPTMACFFGGAQILKAYYTRVTRLAVMGAFSIVVAAAVNLTAGSLIGRIFVWTSITSVAHFLVGAWAFTIYLGLPERTADGSAKNELPVSDAVPGLTNTAQFGLWSAASSQQDDSPMGSGILDDARA